MKMKIRYLILATIGIMITVWLVIRLNEILEPAGTLFVLVLLILAIAINANEDIVEEIRDVVDYLFNRINL